MLFFFCSPAFTAAAPPADFFCSPSQESKPARGAAAVNAVLRTFPSLIARARQFDRVSAPHLLALIIHAWRDPKAGSRRAVVVGVEGDLIVAGAARKAPVQDFAKFVDLVPGDDALLNGIKNPCLAFGFD